MPDTDTNEPVQHPGVFIREELRVRGWTQEDLARILDRPLPTVNEIIQGKRAIMPEMALALASALNGTPETWLQREAIYRLSLIDKTGAGAVRTRARIFDMAPVKELQKRGWIRQTEDVTELEEELKRFFEVSDLSEEPAATAAFRKAGSYTELTPSQRAWCARARQIGKALRAAPFVREALPACMAQLRKFAAHPQEARKVPTLLSKFGIRFVIIEPLQGSKIDGATMWLGDDSPVIAMSLRYDRNDAFWFTLGHEFSHVKNGDSGSIDADLNGPDALDEKGKPAFEHRADEESAAMLIDPEKLESFILRVSPMYSKERINQFANRIKIHPGIIVGQLQHRKQMGWHANRDMLAKIRNIVIPAAVTDGWGQTITTSVFQ